MRSSPGSWRRRSTTSARYMNISASVCWASTGFQLPDSAPTSASDHRLKSSRRSGGDAEQLGDDADWERERQLGDAGAGAGGGGGPEGGTAGRGVGRGDVRRGSSRWEQVH